MDFPIFHLDFFGNRFLIASIAVVHIFINHSMAVGAMPLVAAMEWWGHRTGRREWDGLAYRLLFVCFIVTTTFGALTGVGIWLSTSLVNPYAIGSLIRVFFWAWLAEWAVFVLEVVFIMLYFLTWKRMTGAAKGRHVAIGGALAAFSWLTMGIITAVLGFMMDPGNWMTSRSFLSGVFNPIYLPQLAFRTPMAMLAAGLFALFLAFFFTRRDPDLRPRAVRWISAWVLVWLPLAAAGSLWYRSAVPTWMWDNLPVALTTQDLTDWQGQMGWTLVGMVVLAGAVSLWGVVAPRRLPRVTLLLPFVGCMLLLGTFERVREFIRKPYIITDYMYANGIRVEDYPLLNEEGLLAHATYVSTRQITDDNAVQAGGEIFRIACTRCHTTGGLNGITTRLDAMYGEGPWERDTVSAYVMGMHNTRPFMPPFPGTEAEAGALADYLVHLQREPDALYGAQMVGVSITPRPATPVAGAEQGGQR
jgi:hypothetical protein